VLQSQVQIRLVSEGYDPILGVMHYERDGSPAFVLDMMEPERPKVDQAVLSFLKSEALHPADFTIREDGVVRLNPECSPRATFDFLESVLKPHEDEWIASTPLSGGESLSIRSMLDDIVALRAATVSSLDP
jgi:hypothetical protein